MPPCTSDDGCSGRQMGLGSLIPVPSHCPVFNHSQYAKTRGKLGPFYHMNDVSVYSGRQRGRGGVLLRPCGRGTGLPYSNLGSFSIAADGAGSG